MKKLFLLFISAVCTAVAARDINPYEALKAAGNHLGVTETLLSEAGRPALTQGRGMATSAPDYYVFNRDGGGWVIVAGDDRINPILAYSDEGSFNLDDMPRNLRYWMDGVQSVIDSVRQTKSAVADNTSRMWRNALRSDAPSSEQKVIETALWAQEYPYNIYCPVVSSETKRAVTGCVATAVGIIMNHHKWPLHGTGIIGGYTTASLPTYVPAYSIEDHYYDWDSMPMTDGAKQNSGWTTTSQESVATLLHDIGVALEMDYSYSGSGASGFYATKVLIENMGYSEKLCYHLRSLFTLDRWFSMIKQEIDADRPVLYGGIDKDTGGHAFVCDGYDTSGDMLHINWGWGGYMNGFYALDLGIESENIQFSLEQATVMGITPGDGSPIFDPLGINPIMHNGGYGLIPNREALKKGDLISFMIGYLESRTSYPFDLNIKVSLMDRFGNLKADVVPLYTISYSAFDRYGYLFKTDEYELTVQPELTDYYMVFRMLSDSTWIPIEANQESLPGREWLVCGVTPNPIIVWPQECSAGEEVALELTYGSMPATSVSWLIDGVEYKNATLRLKEGTTIIEAVVTHDDDTQEHIRKIIKL